MNHTYLAWRLGLLDPAAFQRHQHERLVHSLEHQSDITFGLQQHRSTTSARLGHHSEEKTKGGIIAHQAGVTGVAIDSSTGSTLISGGADASIHLWNLEAREYDSSGPFSFRSVASLTRSTSASHTHAITSLSIYPFDPTPTTLLSTAHDKTLKLVSITPAALSPLHIFHLDYAPYTHSLSPLPAASPLIAVGTAHPAIRLFDLRSGLGTHSLPGHNGAIYTIAWSPKTVHILASGSTDGRVLLFDIRRANAAFGSLDLDDAIGVVGEPPASGLGSRPALSWQSSAHGGPVTGVQWTSDGSKLVTAGHDQRIRVWDAATGRNDLVHFGPRIRNERVGELKPLLSPPGCGAPGKEVLLWPNDDGRGDIFLHNMREGNMLRILRTGGVNRAQAQSQSQASLGRLTSGGRINGLVWRVNAESGAGVEMYSAHGDGRICMWTGMPDDEGDELEEDDRGYGASVTAAGQAEHERERQRKRKRDLVGDLVEGLTKRPVTFS